MKRVLPFFLAICTFVSAVNGVARADIYKPGSVGFLYESCKTALEDSKTAKDFDATYCGGFVEGYVAAIAATNVTLPPPSPADPCAAEKSKEYARINNRFCANLPDFKNVPLSDINSLAPTAAGIFFKWIDFIKAQKYKGDILKSPAAAQLNAMIGAGKFCDALGKNKDHNDAGMKEALKKFSLLEYVEIQRGKTIKSEYEACAADYKIAGLKHPFGASRCGGEIAGFITGALSLQSLQKDKPKDDKACGKQIARLYKDIDASKTICVAKDTNPTVAAKVFLDRIDKLHAAPDGAKTDGQAGFGAAGFQPVYYGLMCEPQK